MKLTRSLLIANGWADDARLEQTLVRGAELISSKGISDRKYLLKLLRREFPELHASLTLRDTPAPLSEAIDVVLPEEVKNLEKVRRQMDVVLRSPVAVSGSLMPDACPAGSELGSMPVGSVVVAENAIIPAAHSADICCSMFATFYRSELSLSDELDRLEASTRFGPGPRHDEVPHAVTDEGVWENPFLRGLQSKARAHIADQGDGNHFAYLGEMVVSNALVSRLRELGNPELADSIAGAVGETLRVLVTHHGSRSLGSALYARGLDAAVKATRNHARNIPPNLAWLYADTQEGIDYWDALQYVARWTRANHEAIHERFLERVGIDAVASMGNEHNFVWKRGRQFLHGKGATQAWRDDAGNSLWGLIPLNMAEPILLVAGGDREEFNSFAPHGAGRNYSRHGLMKRYKNELGELNRHSISSAIERETASIDVRWFLGDVDLTECPGAYKSADKVIEQIKSYGLAEVVAKIMPRGCIMAGRAPLQKEKPLSPKQVRQIQHRKERRKTRQRDWMEEYDEI